MKTENVGGPYNLGKEKHGNIQQLPAPPAWSAILALKRKTWLSVLLVFLAEHGVGVLYKTSIVLYQKRSIEYTVQKLINSPGKSHHIEITTSLVITETRSGVKNPFVKFAQVVSFYEIFHCDFRPRGCWCRRLTLRYATTHLLICSIQSLYHRSAYASQLMVWIQWSP